MSRIETAYETCMWCVNDAGNTTVERIMNHTADPMTCAQGFIVKEPFRETNHQTNKHTLTHSLTH